MELDQDQVQGQDHAGTQVADGRALARDGVGPGGAGQLGEHPVPHQVGHALDHAAGQEQHAGQEPLMAAGEGQQGTDDRPAAARAGQPSPLVAAAVDDGAHSGEQHQLEDGGHGDHGGREGVGAEVERAEGDERASGPDRTGGQTQHPRADQDRGDGCRPAVVGPVVEGPGRDLTAIVDPTSPLPNGR